MDASSTHSTLLHEVRNYRLPETAVELLTNHPPLIVSGITASGKNSITKHIIEDGSYRHVITHTTRQPREGEVNAQHYHFVSEQEMLDLINHQEMIEVQAIHGTAVYGISLSAYNSVIQAGLKPLLIIDVQGVEELSKYLPQSVKPFFLVPPSFERWMEWLDKRGRMSHSEKLRRMKSAEVELEKALRSNLFLLIMNNEDSVSTTAQEILQGSRDLSTQHRNRESAKLLIESLKSV